jgi:hypothetical protein
MNKQTFSEFIKALNKFIDDYESKYVQRYGIRDREAGNIIESNLSLDEAEMMLIDYEDKDKQEGIYIKNFYEIFKIDNGKL